MGNSDNENVKSLVTHGLVLWGDYTLVTDVNLLLNQAAYIVTIYEGTPDQVEKIIDDDTDEEYISSYDFESYEKTLGCDVVIPPETTQATIVFIALDDTDIPPVADTDKGSVWYIDDVFFG